MGHDKIFLNEYGELIDVKKFTPSPVDFPAKIEKIVCDICGGSLSKIYHACKACNDDRAYCSEACFDQHRRRKHYETEFCAECGSKLVKRYSNNPKLDSALGKKFRFCNSSCFCRFRDKNICAECMGELPNTHNYYANDIDRAMGKRVKFCSSYCLQKYHKKKICAGCGRKLPSTYKFCRRCGDSQYRFCRRNYCFDQHCRRHHS